MQILQSLSADYTDVIFYPVRFPWAITPIISCIATFLVIVGSILTNSYKTHLGKMILLLNLADFIFAATKTVGSLVVPQTDLLCSILNSSAHFGVVSSVVWGVCFGHALLMAAKSQTTSVSQYFQTYRVVALLLPLVLAVTMCFSDYVITDGKNHCVHRLPMGKFDTSYFIYAQVPLLSCCALSLAFYVLAFCRFKGLEIQGTSYILILYPAIMLLCWLPIMSASVTVLLGVNVSSKLVAFFEAMGQLQGFLDAIAYGGVTRIARSCYSFFFKGNNRAYSDPAIFGHFTRLKSEEIDDPEVYRSDLVSFANQKKLFTEL